MWEILDHSSPILLWQHLLIIDDVMIYNSFSGIVWRKFGNDLSMWQQLIVKEWRCGIIVTPSSFFSNLSSFMPPTPVHSSHFFERTNFRDFKFGNKTSDDVDPMSLLLLESIPKNSTPTFFKLNACCISNDSNNNSFPKGGKHFRLIFVSLSTFSLAKDIVQSRHCLIRIHCGTLIPINF